MMDPTPPPPSFNSTTTTTTPLNQAKRVPFSELRWVHMDSHPDLTLPPDLTPHVVMDPPALYDALECVHRCMCTYVCM
jgi:hypothetical protein